MLRHNLPLALLSMLASIGMYLMWKHFTPTRQSQPSLATQGYLPIFIYRATAIRILPANVLQIRLQEATIGYGTPDKPIVITDRMTIAKFIQALRHAEYRADCATVPADQTDSLEFILTKPIPRLGTHVQFVFRRPTVGRYYGPMFEDVLREIGR